MTIKDPKIVTISGKVVITDWRNVKVVSPEELQKKINVNEMAKEELKKQKDTSPLSISST